MADASVLSAGLTASLIDVAAAAEPRQAEAPSVFDVAALYSAHAPFLLRVADRLLGGGAHVEDVVQEAFVVLHRRQRDLDPTGDVRGWLYRVVANLARQHRRGSFRRFRLSSAVGLEPVPPAPGNPHDATARLERGRAIRAEILRLPFDQREVFVLFELDGLSTREVAAFLQIPEGTVSSRLHAARSAFRAGWKATEGGRGT